MSNPELSIIVATLKHPQEIKSLEPIDYETREDIEIVVRNEEGLCKARNAGIREASANKLIFLDDDAVPCENYVDIAIDALSEHDVVAGRIVDSGHKWVGKTVSHYDQGNEKKSTTQLVGCNMGFRKAVFKEVGLFDENIRWGHDEKELSQRVLDHYEITYVPDLVVIHPYSDGFRDYAEKRYRLGVADIYYWHKVEDSVLPRMFLTLFSPKTYIDNSVRGTIAKLPTGLSKVLGQVVGYKRLLTEGNVFK
jgi:GT2 family glycosyltransferase